MNLIKIRYNDMDVFTYFADHECYIKTIGINAVKPYQKNKNKLF